MPPSEGDPPPIDPENVRAALAAITASRPFKTSPQLTNFLRFVVETALAGRADRLKGYTVAVEALGRGAGFDPQSDPIVRVEAIRLRAALARYYTNGGAGDAVVIELPRGRYVPRFRWNGAQSDPPAAGPAAPAAAGWLATRLDSRRLLEQNRAELQALRDGIVTIRATLRESQRLLRLVSNRRFDPLAQA